MFLSKAADIFALLHVPCGAGCAGRPQHGVGAVVGGKGRLIFLYS